MFITAAGGSASALPAVSKASAAIEVFMRSVCPSQVPQVDEALGRGQRWLELSGLCHERDDLRDAGELDLAALRQHFSPRLGVERQRLFRDGRRHAGQLDD